MSFVGDAMKQRVKITLRDGKDFCYFFLIQTLPEKEYLGARLSSLLPLHFSSLFASPFSLLLLSLYFSFLFTSPFSLLLVFLYFSFLFVFHFSLLLISLHFSQKHMYKGFCMHFFFVLCSCMCRKYAKVPMHVALVVLCICAFSIFIYIYSYILFSRLNNVK